jgi:hypothetical protein
VNKKNEPKLTVRFFREAPSGAEPVRDWLLDLSVTERRDIGSDIKTVQFGWPLGMPLVEHLQGDLGSAHAVAHANSACTIRAGR